MNKKNLAGWEYILFPLFLINITTSANTWEIFGISIGQVFYYIIIVITSCIVMITPYRKIGLIFLAMAAIFLFIHLVTQSPLADGLKVVSLGMLFLIAGARIYGNNPGLLYRQLVIFFAISIPFMICQVTGVSSFFMIWNTDYAHTLDVLDSSEIGTFKVIPVYPTLFVGLDELNYQIGQGRPNGLFHSNNILSIFVAIGLGLNMITSKSIKLRYSDLILMVMITLTMSLMVFSVTILLYTYYILMGGNKFKIKSLKLFFTLLIFIGLYYFFFPGLFMINLGETKFLMSFLTRGLDLANSMGFSAFNDLYSDQILLIGDAYTEEGTYSQLSVILKSKFAFPIFIALIIIVILHFRGFRLFRKKTGSSTTEFNIFLFCCVFSQLAISYMVAPVYQFMLGFAFFPLFKKYWDFKVKSFD